MPLPSASSPQTRIFSTVFYTGYTHGKNRPPYTQPSQENPPPLKNSTPSSHSFVSVRSLCCTVKQCILQLFLSQALQKSFHHTSCALLKTSSCAFFYFIVTFSAFSYFFPIIKGLFADMNIVITSVFKYLVFSRY